jgi:glycosidase
MKIKLTYGDPFEWENGTWRSHITEMKKIGSDHLYDYWQTSIHPPHFRIRYGFELIGHENQIFYTEKGFINERPNDPGSYFCFPYLHSNEIFSAPDWVKDTVWYQIFPERFANGKESLNPENTLAWGSVPPSSTNFFGGDFQGIIDHLDYLGDLGVTGIYLTPVFKAKSNHKYDTIDYFELDPQFGEKQLFQKFIIQCHSRGIKVMLDAVFNHCGYYFPPFQDVLQNGEKSKYRDWFYVNQFPLEGGPLPNYRTFSFVETMPKLNTQNPEVKKYLLDVGRYWVSEFDIDGWRLDVANEIDHIFWREFRTALKTIKQDLYILGEVWHDAMPWLRGDQFDGVMNYPFTSFVIQLFAKGEITTKEFIEGMTAVIFKYPETVNQSLFNLVGSHDTPRILSECGGDIRKAKIIFTFLLTYPGTPCIYYGDEIGLSGEMDPGCRGCMEWDPTQQNIELFQHIQKFIKLRKEVPLLANEGDFSFLHSTGVTGCLAFTKSTETEVVLVVMNPSDENSEFPIPFHLRGKKITDLIHLKEYAAEASQLLVQLPPYGYEVLHFSKE